MISRPSSGTSASSSSSSTSNTTTPSKIISPLPKTSSDVAVSSANNTIVNNVAGRVSSPRSDWKILASQVEFEDTMYYIKGSIFWWGSISWEKAQGYVDKIKKGDVAAMEEMLMYYTDSKDRNSGGNLAHLAALVEDDTKSARMIECIIKKKCTKLFDQQAKAGGLFATPLMVMIGHHPHNTDAIISMLTGKNVNMSNKERITPLQAVIAQYGYYHALRRHDRKTQLIEATKIITEMVKKGVKLDDYNDAGISALGFAASI